MTSISGWNFFLSRIIAIGSLYRTLYICNQVVNNLTEGAKCLYYTKIIRYCKWLFCSTKEDRRL
jgi:hypothetical protein